MANYQERIFLQLLDNNDSINLVKKILRSPLGLSVDIIVKLFSNKMGSLKDDLDKINVFSAANMELETNTIKSYSNIDLLNKKIFLKVIFSQLTNK